MKYIISSTVCSSLKKALQYIKEWQNSGTLKEETRVYEVSNKVSVYEPKFELVKSSEK